MGCVFGFTSECRDPVSGGYPLGHGYRWYLPSLMRFNAPDDWSPFGLGGVNPYSYCGCDPVNHDDPSGHIFPELDDIHFESTLEAGLRLDRELVGAGEQVADPPAWGPRSRSPTPIAAEYAASSPATPRSPVRSRASSIFDPAAGVLVAGSPAASPGGSMPVLSPRSPFATAFDELPPTWAVEQPSTLSPAAGPSAPPELTWQAIFAEAQSRPLGGSSKQPFTTRLTRNVVDVLADHNVTVRQLPDYPGIAAASKDIGYRFDGVTVESIARKVIGRTDIQPTTKAAHIRTLTYFNELPRDIPPIF